MNTLLRIAAALSFGFCLAGGLLILGIGVAHGHGDAIVIDALGLVLIGVAFFAGSVLLVLAEKFRAR